MRTSIVRSRAPRAAWLAGLLVAAACRERAPAPYAPEHAAAAPTPAAPRADASELLATFECQRCHDVPGFAPAPEAKHCVACHQAIHAGTFAADAQTLAAWRPRIVSLRWVPTLAAADRLRRTWLREFLLAPHDVRPALVAEMPRLALSAAEAERLAAHLVPDDDPGAEPPPAAAEIARGEQLYRGMACGRCHRFSGAAVDDPGLHAAGRPSASPAGDAARGVGEDVATTIQRAVTVTGGEVAAVATVGPSAADAEAAWHLAPDLRFARARMTTVKLAAWIAAPRGAMPAQGIGADEARALAAFVAAAPLAPLARPPPVVRPAPLTRRVTWDEVEARVFRATCWHCHAAADYARGDGGPGNSGGFGFAARGLDLSSYSGIAAGSLDDDGEPRSVFAPGPDGTPRLIAHLLARHTEHAGQVVDGVRGMPLGLPPLPLHDIALVDAWIAQGRPR
jgi:hypothetical protein